LPTVFRVIVAIPWIIWMYLYGLAALIATVIAWFAVLFTKRYPDSLYRFISGYVEVAAQVGGFLLLATDEWPPFVPRGDDSYPVKVDVAPPQVEYRRSRTFFKHLLMFPQQILLYGIAPLVAGAAFITWWRVLFTGKQSATMHDAIRAGLAYATRSNAFALVLTEIHPRLLELAPQQYPADAPSLPGPGQMPQEQLTQGSAPPPAPPAEPQA
jgi:hypothetical protein